MVDHHLTFADALVEAVARAGVYNKNDQAPPVAILWTDRERAWEPLAPILHVRLPLLTLGPYAPESRTGPAYWLRCMIARTLPEDLLPDDAIPVIYLPGVGKADLRAVDECPRALQPLAELQYRGVIWTHRNGRDWTPAAFVGSADGGLGVEIGADGATREALYRALPKLAAEPLDHMRRVAPLRAAYFDGLLIADEVRGILRWLNNPAGYQASDPAAWESFRALCRRAYGFDPARDGPLTAATLLGGRQGVWEVVWQRFVEAPHAYPNVPEMLRRGRPQGILPLMDADSPSSFPQDNEAAEASLRDSLRALSEALPLDARAEIDALEAAHGRRRYGVWATLGQAPLAVALEHLATLARVAERPLGGTTVDVIAAAYVEWAWQADGAVIDALAAVEEHAQVLAVGAAITAIYRPWLEAAATALQRAVSVDDGRQSYQAGGPLTATTEPGTCVLFSDALRFDAARRLVTDLEQRGLACTVDWGLTALPGVTPTAKPAVAPLGADSGLHGGAGLEPAVTTAAGGTRAVDVKVLRRLLQDRGYQILLGEDDLGDPTGLGWTELGAIDSYGHANGWKLAHHLPGELRALARRVEALLKAGWRDIVLVTDHGWLLLPGGLPKVDLPEHLTAPRKGRCARLANGAAIDGQTVPWYWDRDVRIAMAPGISCYEAGKEYEHGGLSPQECVTPILTVTAAPRTAPTVAIHGIKWIGLRCRVTLSGSLPGAVIDIRTKPADAASTVVTARKGAGAEGQASLTVPDDDRIGDAAVVVVLDGNGQIQAQEPTIVGGDSA